MRGHRITRLASMLVIISGLCVLPTHAHEDPTGVIRALYAADQPWNNKNINLYNPTVLSRYFTGGMTRLFLKLGDINAHCPDGYVCGLDFDPILAAQDYDDHPDLGLRIEESSQRELHTYAVHFTLVKNTGETTLLYKLVHTKDGWRIADIIYPREKTSLTEIIKALIKENQGSKK